MVFNKGDTFPSPVHKNRIERYNANLKLFKGEHFDALAIYRSSAIRIQRVIGNFEDIISYPVLLNYHRLLAVKMADLVCGEHPTITGPTNEASSEIKEIRERVFLDDKLYTTVLDISRYGDAIHRRFINNRGEPDFTVWDPREWYPEIASDGTNRIIRHRLCWIETKNANDMASAAYGFNTTRLLHVQIHSELPEELGYYTHEVYELDTYGVAIRKFLSTEQVDTGFVECAVSHIRSYITSDSPYGYDDFVQLDSLLSEIFTRIGQIACILDKHADPSITGPASMLKLNPLTGEYSLDRGKFFATSPGETPPSYMVWDGQLNAGFKELELLINQLYIISEMGAAMLGGKDGSSSAISGVSMRFKMAGPLSKARRITNSLTLATKRLLSELSDSIEVKDLSISWADGLPNDPKEMFELVKLATGAEAFMPVVDALVEYLGKSTIEAEKWVADIEAQIINTEGVNKPGPQDGTGVNPLKTSSDLSLNNL